MNVFTVVEVHPDHVVLWDGKSIQDIDTPKTDAARATYKVHMADTSQVEVGDIAELTVRFTKPVPIDTDTSEA